VQDERSDREVSWKLLALLVLVLAVVAFAPAMFGEYIYDDNALIARNPYAHSFAYLKRWFTTDFWDTGEEIKRFGNRLVYYRPAISFSYALDWKLGGGEPLFFHLTNMVWHGAASVLAFLALRRWIGAAVPAFLAALLFAIHPTKAESVAWIAGRTDVFCVVAVLLASEGIARRIRGEKYGLAIEIVGTILAYLTKEQAIVLPAFAAVETWVILGRPAIDVDSIKKMIRAGLPQLVLALVYLAIRSKVLPVRGNLINSGFRPGEYFGQVAETFGRYLELVVFPHDLSVQQALIQTPGGRLMLNGRYMIAGAIAVLALVGLAIAMRRRAPAVTLGIALFFVTILPTSNVLPMGMLTMISERFLFMPTLGLALAIGWGLHVVAERGERSGRIAYAIAALVSAVFLIGSMRRSDDFLHGRRFWAHEMSMHPDSIEAWRFAVADAIEDKRYNDALRAMMRGAQLASQRYAHTGAEADFIVEAGGVLAVLTPDLEEKDLLDLDKFFAELLVPEPGIATLSVGPARIRISRQAAAIKPRLKALKPVILMNRALIASRLGDDPGAIALAAATRADCPLCTQQVSEVAIVHARAGDYAYAYKTLDEISSFAGEEPIKDKRATVKKAELYGKQSASAPEGPIKLQLRGLELSTLDAWGRAYKVLRDYKEGIKKAPGFALGFAELAFRAGDTKTAREVLAAIVPEEKIDPTLRAWSKKMGWQ
jgi:hypothetical protein